MTAPAQVAFPDRILKDRIEGFVGRAWAIDEVAKWIDTETGDRFMLIMGEPGCGKTALAAWMAGFGEQQAESMPKQFATVRECWTAKHFCFAEERRGSVHPARFAQALASQISQRFPYFGQCILESETSTVIGHAEAKVNWGTVIGAYIENLIIKSPNPEDVYERSVRQPLLRLYQVDPTVRIFILVDSLDEALTIDGTTIVDLIAGSSDLPENVRFLVTSRSDPEVIARFSSVRVLDLSSPANASLANKDIRAYLLARPVSRMTTQQIDELVAAAAGNFLYIRFLLQEIAAGKRAVSDVASLPVGLHALYRISLDRVARGWRRMGRWKNLFQPILGRLSVAATDVPQLLLGEWTRRPSEVAATLSEILQLVESIPALDDSLRYRLYHRSLADFLALSAYRANGSTLPNPYHTPPFVQHKEIIDFYVKRFRNDWPRCDEYGLRHLVGHQSRCIDLVSDLTERARIVKALYATLLDPSFGDAQQGKLGELGGLLGDLRTGLRVALREKDLAKALTFFGRYREAQRTKRVAPTVFESIRERNFAAALKRSEVYQSIPNWGRCLFLYVAWEAAQRADIGVVMAAINAAWNSPISKGPFFPQNDLANALFAHVALLLSQRRERKLDVEGWMRELDPERPGWDLDHCTELIRPKPALDERDIRKMFEHLGSLEEEFQKYGRERGYDAIGRNFANAEAIAYHASRLAEVLGNLIAEPEGQNRLDGALDSVVENPYPAYRDIALVALGIAALSSNQLMWVGQRLQRILQAALDQEGVIFTFDLAAVLAQEAYRRRLPAGRLNEYCEQALGTVDSWGTRLRALNAQSLALFRQANTAAAFSKLEEAAQQPPGFAGFFAVHYLALANRWQEFGFPAESKMLVELVERAANSAQLVENYEFRLQRSQLVEDYRKWCDQETPTLAEAINHLTVLQAHETRMIYLDHISARWAAADPPDIEALEATLLFALSDSTVLDGLLARFLGLHLNKLSDGELKEAVEVCDQFLTTAHPWEFLEKPKNEAPPAFKNRSSKEVEQQCSTPEYGRDQEKGTLEEQLKQFREGSFVRVKWHPMKKGGTTEYGTVLQAYLTRKLAWDEEQIRVVFMNAESQKKEIASLELDEVEIIDRLP